MDARASAVLHAWSAEGERLVFEAPLDDRIAGMIAEVCAEVVARRAACHTSGVDGVWYLLQAPGGTRSALAWSPKPKSDADAVVDMFAALRAYVSSPAALRWAALRTLYSETYATHKILGLFDKKRSAR